MSDLTNAQKIRSEAVDQVIKAAATGQVLNAEQVVRSADKIAQFVKDGVLPVPPSA